MDDLLQERRRDDHLGNHFLPARGQERKHRGLFVAGHVALDIPLHRLHRRFFDEVPAERVGGDGDHVLARRIAGLVIKPKKKIPAGQRAPEFHKLAMAGCFGNALLKSRRFLHGKLQKVAGIKGGLENEARRPGNGFRQAHGRRTARVTDDVSAAVIRRHERAFTGRHGNKKVAVGLNAIDSQWANHGHRQLGKPDEILDVVGERFRGRLPGFTGQTIHGNSHLFEKALTFLKPGGSVVIAKRQPVGKRFSGGQAGGKPFSQSIRV